MHIIRLIELSLASIARNSQESQELTISFPYENNRAFMERLKKSTLGLPRIAKETRNDCSICESYQAFMERFKKLSLVSIVRNKPSQKPGMTVSYMKITRFSWKC